MNLHTHAICPQPVIPVRREPAHTSEMVSQLLFGETFAILETRGSWLHVRGDMDAYTGWVDKAQCRILDPESCEEVLSVKYRIVADPYALLKGISFNSPVHLPCGSVIHARGGYEPIWLPGNTVVGTAISPTEPVSMESMCTRAADFIGSPYLWGGRTHFGFDCSGFVQLMMRLAGVFLPRDAAQQAGVGEDVSFHEDAMPGDVAFFDDEEGRITHTGIIIGQGRILHASGRVQEDRIDHQGIFNRQARKYTHRLRLIRRYQPGGQYVPPVARPTEDDEGKKGKK